MLGSTGERPQPAHEFLLVDVQNASISPRSGFGGKRWMRAQACPSVSGHQLLSCKGHKVAEARSNAKIRGKYLPQARVSDNSRQSALDTS